MPENSPPPRPALRQRRTVWRWVALTTVLLGVLVALSLFTRIRFMLTPTYVKAAVLDAVKPYLNGDFEVDEARMMLFRDLRLKNYRATHKGGTVPDISGEYLRLHMNPWGRLGGSPEMAAASGLRTTVRITIRPDGSCNLLDLFDTPGWDADGGATTSATWSGA